jgi:hypothetical protein
MLRKQFPMVELEVLASKYSNGFQVLEECLTARTVGLESEAICLRSANKFSRFLQFGEVREPFGFGEWIAYLGQVDAEETQPIRTLPRFLFESRISSSR